jgi:hypothetical protein
LIKREAKLLSRAVLRVAKTEVIFSSNLELPSKNTAVSSNSRAVVVIAQPEMSRYRRDHTRAFTTASGPLLLFVAADPTTAPAETSSLRPDMAATEAQSMSKAAAVSTVPEETF